LRRYLLEPFPWLVMAVFQADQKHGFTGGWGTDSGHDTGHAEGWSQRAPSEVTNNPLRSTEPTGPPPQVVGDVTAL
jgi:hypothetical protein